MADWATGLFKLPPDDEVEHIPITTELEHTLPISKIEP